MTGEPVHRRIELAVRPLPALVVEGHRIAPGNDLLIEQVDEGRGYAGVVDRLVPFGENVALGREKQHVVADRRSGILDERTE